MFRCSIKRPRGWQKVYHKRAVLALVVKAIVFLVVVVAVVGVKPPVKL